MKICHKVKWWRGVWDCKQKLIHKIKIKHTEWRSLIQADQNPMKSQSGLARPVRVENVSNNNKINR